MRYLLLQLIILIGLNSLAQKVDKFEVRNEGDILLAKNVSIPKISSGYTVWLPSSKDIKGLIVFTHERKDTTKPDFFITYANKNNLAVMYATTDNAVEFLFDTKHLREIESYISVVLLKYKIPRHNLFYCGMSLEGTRAMKLAQYAMSELSVQLLKPSAIAICDAPLDFVRLFHEMKRSIKVNFSPLAVSEGSWVTAYLESNLGGKPDQTLDAYVNYSPYYHYATDNYYLDKFKNIPIRAYTEPDVLWWMSQRRKDFYGMNALDMAGLINELNILGNQKAQLIVTQNKGFGDDGQKQPHSWSIVDEKDLIDWFISLLF